MAHASSEFLHRKQIDRAAYLLSTGNLVAIPTETVYGLAGDARNDDAVRAIYRAKGRPEDNPLIVHFHSCAHLAEYGIVLTAPLARLMRKYSPGPLTVVVPASPLLSRLATAGQPTVAVRIPRHPVARALLRACNFPLVAPSANLSGKTSPTTARMAYHALAGKIAAVLDGGASSIGVESTIIRHANSHIDILRAGAISAHQIEKQIAPHYHARTHTAPHNERDGEDARRRMPTAPGGAHPHYQPQVHIYPFATHGARIDLSAHNHASPGDQSAGSIHARAALAIFTRTWHALIRAHAHHLTHRPITILKFSPQREVAQIARHIRTPPIAQALHISYIFFITSHTRYARYLFRLYDTLDNLGADALYAELPSTMSACAEALIDRVRRAAEK